jgi:hypothetical protein
MEVMESSLKNLHNAPTTLNCAKVVVEKHQRYISKWCVKDRENTVRLGECAVPVESPG